MTDIDRLNVSLTKHGAHKVAELLERHEPDQVLAATWNPLPGGIRIDRAQARKTLSAMPGDRLPGIWGEAKKRGRDDINKLVLLGIIFSHHDIMDALKVGSTGTGTGVVTRERFDSPKAFTNLKNNFEVLGFATTTSEQQFGYNFNNVVSDYTLAPLALQLFHLKLSEANWSGVGDLIEECVSVEFHKVLGLPEESFRAWLDGTSNANEDEIPDTTDPETSIAVPFAFKPGHKPRKIGEVARKGHGKNPKARLIHNQIQNALFSDLEGVHGKGAVGCEVSSGVAGTYIDAVVKSGTNYIFYEIKTSPSLRKCIREAIPQLLEYAYWPNSERATELVIVTRNSPTDDAKQYLENIRKRFGLPIFHETIDITTGKLSDRI